MAKNETVTIKNIGACLLVIGKQNLSPGESVEVDSSLLDNQGIKHLMHRKDLEIEDNPKETREVVEEFRKGAKKPKAEKGIDESEVAPTIK